MTVNKVTTKKESQAVRSRAGSGHRPDTHANGPLRDNGAGTARRSSHGITMVVLLWIPACAGMTEGRRRNNGFWLRWVFRLRRTGLYHPTDDDGCAFLDASEAGRRRLYSPTNNKGHNEGCLRAGFKPAPTS